MRVQGQVQSQESVRLQGRKSTGKNKSTETDRSLKVNMKQVIETKPLETTKPRKTYKNLQLMAHDQKQSYKFNVQAQLNLRCIIHRQRQQ